MTESLDPASGLVTRDAVPAAADLAGRIMICRRARVLPVEVIVRGYLAGSGWQDYRRTGAVSGISLPDGLRHSDRLPAPLFTPSTKAELGTHDENISFDEMIDRLVPIADDLEMAGALAERVRSIALALYGYGAAIVARAGILLADTKFEFGLSASGELLLIDEVLTPDSSRFWNAAAYEPGRAQASYDKQFVRDWLEPQPWDKTAPGPELPAEIVAGTRERYVEAFERITGASFARYLAGGRDRPMSASFRFAVNVTPKAGILDPQGRAVEQSLPHLGVSGVSAIRVGRRVELTVEASDAAAARTVVERLAGELLSNPLIEAFGIEPLGAASSLVGEAAR